MLLGACHVSMLLYLSAMICSGSLVRLSKGWLRDGDLRQGAIAQRLCWHHPTGRSTRTATCCNVNVQIIINILCRPREQYSRAAGPSKGAVMGRPRVLVPVP